ncbi:MAG: OmpA family protein [Deltaproteobacteria bacterium]|nr:OmpA family protein [Deltaproteobacteria bacterium]
MRLAKTNPNLLYVAVGAVCLIGATGVGCAARNNQALERARASYMQARQDPQLVTHAPIALQEAETALNKAEQTWEETGKQKEVDHLAYVTERKIDLARTTAQSKAAEVEMQQLGEERERVRLEARTHEAERAQQQAAARGREAEQARLQAQEAADRAHQLEDELAALKAKQTERGLVLTLNDVLFEYDKADLKDGAMRNLYPLVTFLRENPERNLVIEGHTDSLGSDSYNFDLSERRAGAVQSFLLQNGISPMRIVARGYGETYPVTSNDTEAGRQQNRRVEVVILHEGELAASGMR